jgi:hypothetical protein
VSKQVNYNYGAFYVNTSLLKEHADAQRVIIQCKGAKAIPFYRYPEQVFNDPEYLDNIRLAGYSVKDLIIVADMLKDKEVSSVKLDNYISGVKDGYSKAQKDFEKALLDSINEIIERA